MIRKILKNVQKNSTAIRITHVPSGIVVVCQNERSQRQNKEIAMRILMSRLLDLEQQKQNEMNAGLSSSSGPLYENICLECRWSVRVVSDRISAQTSA